MKKKAITIIKPKEVADKVEQVYDKWWKELSVQNKMRLYFTFKKP